MARPSDDILEAKRIGYDEGYDAGYTDALANNEEYQEDE